MADRASRHQRQGKKSGRTALLVVDMLNTYEHEESDELAASVADAVPGIRSLIDSAQEQDAAIVYVNDNYGDWNSSAQELAQAACEGRHPELVEPVLPPPDASFVIKARHSIFYGTPLEYLLDGLGVDRLVLTGQVTEQCILYSALDAHVRHFDVVIPRDAVAHIYEELARAALKMMERNMSAEIVGAEECSFGA